MTMCQVFIKRGYSNWSLLFDGSILKINPNLTYFRDYYRCSKIDLTSIEKERLVRRFLQMR